MVAFPEQGVVAGGPQRDPELGRIEVRLSQEHPSTSGHIQMANLCSTLLAGAGLGAVASAPRCFPGAF